MSYKDEETRKKVRAIYKRKVKENRNKKKKSVLDWVPMKFKRDTLDGGELLNTFQNVKVY